MFGPRCGVFLIRKSVAKEDLGKVFRVLVEPEVKDSFEQGVACELGV